MSRRTYLDELTDEQSSFSNDWRASSAAFQALGEIAVLPKNDVNDPIKLKVKLLLIQKDRSLARVRRKVKGNSV
ncbi:MAG: hypothetical protein IPJ30_14260 [Acidobacteria bacterium]|nr:hypothetical protein [Acidobacteriota bacterium]